MPLLSNNSIIAVAMGSRSLLDKNRDKIAELQPHVQWAANQWMMECFREGQTFKITETYRSQERQLKLYSQGRWTPGIIVTWTLSSNHKHRLACDIYPLGHAKYEDIAQIAQNYGIMHPIRKDKPHFEFHYAMSKPIVLSIDEMIKTLTRGIQRAKNRGLVEVIRIKTNVLKRLKNRR